MDSGLGIPPKDEGAETAVGSSAEPAEPAPTTCWRCGKLVAGGVPRCPYCAAALREAGAATGERAAPAWRPSGLARVMVAFALLLAANVVLATFVRVSGWSGRHGTAAEQYRLLALLLASEAFDALVVLATWLAVVRQPRPPSATAWRDFGAWLAAAPLLVGLLAANVGYHRLLLDYLGVSPDRLEPSFGLVWWPWLVLAICVQPALVEELFFRGIAFDSLTATTGAGTALLLSSVMFALAHTGVVLSMPLLFLMGLCFGLARIWSGGLVLPMAMHAAHNAGVLFLTETYR